MSFYYTEKIVKFVQTKTPLYEEILLKSKQYVTKGTNAVINEDFIIPGINTIEVDIEKSYYKMKNIDNYNSDLLVYKTINPSVSVVDNKDKIIKKGNILKRGISIITNNEVILNYCYLNNIEIDVFSSLVNNYNEKFEYINNEKDEKSFYAVEKLLNKYNKNKNICFLNNNYDLCKNNNKYIIDSTLNLNKSNILEVKSNVESGYIIFVEDNVTIDLFGILLNTIKNNNLKIMYLSKLISEER